MTLIQLQDKLGEQIELLTDDSLSPEMRRDAAQVAPLICSMAKQMINNADVVLRAEKLIDEGKLQNSGISRLVGRPGNKA